MNVLIRAARDHIPYDEVEIQTLYYDDNKGSHLHAVKDSWRVFLILMSGLGKYTLATGLSALLDITVFYIMQQYLLHNLPPSTRYLCAIVIARITSSFVNFSLNKNYVFPVNQGKVQLMIRFYSLWLVQMIASYFLSMALHTLIPVSATLIIVFVDIFLGIMSYQVQMRWVFRGNQSMEMNT